MLWDIQSCDKVHDNTLLKYNKSARKAGWIMYENPEYIYLQKNEKIKCNNMNFQRWPVKIKEQTTLVGHFPLNHLQSKTFDLRLKLKQNNIGNIE